MAWKFTKLDGLWFMVSIFGSERVVQWKLDLVA